MAAASSSAASSSFEAPVASSSPFQDEDLYGDSSGWVGARTHCPHLHNLHSDLHHLPVLQTPCNRCEHFAENWVCLCCKEVLCSRFINGHMLEHFRDKGHCLAMSFSDLSVWCFSCDAYLDAQVISRLRPAYETMHLLKFGEPPPYRIDLIVDSVSNNLHG